MGRKIPYQENHRITEEGSNNLSNCLPSCHRCNNSKKSKRFKDWYPELSGVFSEDRLKKIKKWLYEDYKLYIRQK